MREALSLIGTALVVNILIGLAIGGAIGHWLPAAFVIIAGLIAAGIAVAIIATVQALGTNLNATFSSVSTALK